MREMQTFRLCLAFSLILIIGTSSFLNIALGKSSWHILLLPSGTMSVIGETGPSNFNSAHNQSYSPAETYPVYRTIYDQMIKSFEIRPQISSAATSLSTYDNRNYGIQIQYPSDWSVQESKSSGELINVATFVSPTGPNSNPNRFQLLILISLTSSL